MAGVLQALAHVLPREHADTICGCIPQDLVWCLRCGPTTPDPLIDSNVFLGWVMSSIETTGGTDHTLGGGDPLAAMVGKEAHARIRAVLEELWPLLDVPTRDAVRAYLPSGVAAHAPGTAGPQHRGEQ
ncbi:hypothetical protein YT1_0353 [Rhodococcus ruber]|nr:hypothetical protein YT1_0353 [Rhodococcus ruber]